MENQCPNFVQQSELLFQTLVEKANDVIVMTSAQGEFLYISPNFTEFTGHRVSDFIGKPFIPLIHPDDQPYVIQANRRAFQAGETQHLEFRVKNKAGEWQWYRSTDSVVKDEKGDNLYMITIAHDITELKNVLCELEEKNRRLRETQSRLAQTELMATLGTLVASIAHEINSPVGAIKSLNNTAMLAVSKLKQMHRENHTEDVAGSPQFNKALHILENANTEIEKGCAKVSGIVKTLRRFVHLDETESEVADIHNGLEDTVFLLQPKLKHRIKVIKNFGEIPSIVCYPGKLNQVFLNILTDAIEAITEQGQITITTFYQNNMVYVIIEDTGKGIPKGNLGKIFEPGFTTKSEGTGTGLGLSFCRQIIHDHNGEIKVDSSIGKGTTFTIMLPENSDSRNIH